MCWVCVWACGRVGVCSSDSFACHSVRLSRIVWSLTKMRFALAMHECTEAAAAAVATSLSSDARAAAANVSACICAKSAIARSGLAPPVRVANWSIMSTARTTAWPQTTKLSATRRRLASRRSRSGSAGASGASTRAPSIEILTSTTGSSA